MTWTLGQVDHVYCFRCAHAQGINEPFPQPTPTVAAELVKVEPWKDGDMTYYTLWYRCANGHTLPQGATER